MRSARRGAAPSLAGSSVHDDGSVPSGHPPFGALWPFSSISPFSPGSWRRRRVTCLPKRLPSAPREVTPLLTPPVPAGEATGDDSGARRADSSRPAWPTRIAMTGMDQHWIAARPARRSSRSRSLCIWPLQHSRSLLSFLILRSGKFKRSARMTVKMTRARPLDPSMREPLRPACEQPDRPHTLGAFRHSSHESA